MRRHRLSQSCSRALFCRQQKFFHSYFRICSKKPPKNGGFLLLFVEFLPLQSVPPAFLHLPFPVGSHIIEVPIRRRGMPLYESGT